MSQTPTINKLFYISFFVFGILIFLYQAGTYVYSIMNNVWGL